MILTLPLSAVSASDEAKTDYHTPVLFDEVIEYLKVVEGGKYIDATLGGGGYSFEILKRGGIVLGIDLDQKSIEHVEGIIKYKKLKKNRDIFLEQGNFADIKKIAEKWSFEKTAGIIFDLGMSSFQLEHSARGFSFRKDEFLDMRMDNRQKLTAADVIKLTRREEFYEIFSKFAEEFHSRAIADAIIRVRAVRPITRTRELADIVKEVIGKKEKRANGKFDNNLFQKRCARIFQAIRIVVNNETENLKKGLSDSFDLLHTGGRIAVLSYHSLEDRIVKFKFREAERKGILRVITKKPVRADYMKIRNNYKSRSVRLRIAEKKHG